MRWFLATALAFGIALSAGATPRIELMAPRGGDVLDGGREATISWTAAALPPDAEEWEAFLSVDGGAYYAARITPHLDAAIRSFRWHVPNVATSSARILIRVGNEHDEHAVEFAQTFTIVPRRTSFEPDGPALLDGDETGEAARPDDPAVGEWVSGARNGSGSLAHRHRDEHTVGGVASLPGDPPVSATRTSCDSLHPGRPRETGSLPRLCDHSSHNAPSGPRPLLLLTTRLNI